jgi:hypothetical protein
VKIKRHQLLPNYEALVLLLDELRVQAIIKTDKGYSIQSTKTAEDSIDVDMEDFR